MVITARTDVPQSQGPGPQHGCRKPRRGSVLCCSQLHYWGDMTGAEQLERGRLCTPPSAPLHCWPPHVGFQAGGLRQRPLLCAHGPPVVQSRPCGSGVLGGWSPRGACSSQPTPTLLPLVPMLSLWSPSGPEPTASLCVQLPLTQGALPEALLHRGYSMVTLRGSVSLCSLASVPL